MERRIACQTGMCGRPFLSLQAIQLPPRGTLHPDFCLNIGVGCASAGGSSVSKEVMGCLLFREFPKHRGLARRKAFMSEFHKEPHPAKPSQEHS